MSEVQAQQQSARAPRDGGLLGGLLSGLLSGPAVGDELGEAAEGPAVFELADDVGQIAVGLDAEQEAAVGEGEGGGEALAKHANSALAAAIVDLEAPIAARR